MSELKVCNKCHLELPLSSFTITDHAKGWRKGACKACESKRVRAYYAANPDYRARCATNSMKQAEANPERAAVWRRRSDLKRKYGLTSDQFDQLFEVQGRKCALCGATEHGRAYGNGRSRQLLPGDAPNWPVDHCHTNGHVRGLICFTCNTRLGAYEALLQDVGEVKLLEYLTRPSPVLALPIAPLVELPPDIRATARFVAELPPRYVQGKCMVEGCGKDQHARNMCFNHYNKARRRGANVGPSDDLSTITVRGATHHKVSLTESQAREIKFSTEKGADLARKFAVKPSVISSIRHGHTWKHLEPETMQ